MSEAVAEGFDSGLLRDKTERVRQRAADGNAIVVKQGSLAARRCRMIVWLPRHRHRARSLTSGLPKHDLPHEMV